MAKKKTAGRRKKIQLTEFRAWLEGVEELQPDDWCPTVDQWALIRAKIDCIVEAEPAPQPVQQPVQQQPMQMRPGLPQPQMQPQMPQQVPLQAVDASGQPAPVPMVGDPTPPPAAPAPSQNPLLQQKPGANGTPLTKTPDLDNADGNFTSSFT